MKLQIVTERPVGYSWEDWLISIFLVANSLAIFVIWTTNLQHNTFQIGIVADQEGIYPLTHLIAELATGGLSLAAGVSLWLRTRWSRGLSLFAFGGLMYSAINFSGWALHKDPMLLLPLATSLIATALAVPYLLYREARYYDSV